MDVLVLQHIACEPPGVFEDVLDERGIEVRRVELDEGELSRTGVSSTPSSRWAGRCPSTTRRRSPGCRTRSVRSARPSVPGSLFVDGSCDIPQPTYGFSRGLRSTTRQVYRPVPQLEYVAELYRWRDVGDPEVVAVAAVNANWYSDVHQRSVTLGDGWRQWPNWTEWRLSLRVTRVSPFARQRRF
jgi:hypothetical protein